MRSILTITNFSLLYLVALVLLSLSLGIILYPFDSAAKLMIFLVFLLGANWIGAYIAVILKAKFIKQGSSLLRPVSTTWGAIFVNSVISIWLCVVVALVIIILQGKGNSTVALGILFLILFGIGFGRHLQKQFSMKYLLPYGVSFFVVLVTIMLVDLISK